MKEQQKNKSFKSGFIAVVGRTNVGKSTLINTMIGQKITIVSDKPQTTRNNIRLILTSETSQMVFIDTPGFHRPKSKLSAFMVDSASDSVKDVDVVVLVVAEDVGIGKGDMMLIEKLKESAPPTILAINKTDKITKEDILKKISLFKEFDFIKEIVPISALTGDNTKELISVIENYLPEGPMYFPEDMLTDRAEKFVVSESIREKALRLLNEEIPHGVAVEITLMREREDKPLMDIEATIYCERKSHKAIIIGKNGSMLKRIGTGARADMEDMLGIQVNLKLWVKVRENWTDKQFDLNDLGYTQEKDY